MDAIDIGCLGRELRNVGESIGGGAATNACNLGVLLLGVTDLRIWVGVLARLAPGLVLDGLPFA